MTLSSLNKQKKTFKTHIKYELSTTTFPQKSNTALLWGQKQMKRVNYGNTCYLDRRDYSATYRYSVTSVRMSVKNAATQTEAADYTW